MKPRREPMLPPIREMSWWWWSVPFLTAGVWATLKWFNANWAWWAWLKHSAWNVVVIFVPLYAVIVFTAVRTRRIRRTYRESGGRLCTRCVQPLNGLGEIGLCPECGEPFHIEHDRVRWRHAGVDMGDRRAE
ncbi:MAG: hypothetical protein QM783_05160 [Phycisphaerales bacterium]